jgi:ABC-2 type transport system permease protein
VLFPGFLGDVAAALPFSALIQVPIDIWLGQTSGAQIAGALAFQGAWIVVLLALGHLVLTRATRKLVVQGG